MRALALVSVSLLVLSCGAAFPSGSAGGRDPDDEVIEQNRAPIAVLDEEFEVAVDEIVRLDGTRSHDPDGDTVYAAPGWQIVSMPEGVQAQLTAPWSFNPYFVARQEGTHVVSLTVGDGDLESEPALMTITVVPPDRRPPVADAGPDRTAEVGSTVSLDSSASFVPTPLRSVRWEFVSVPTESRTWIFEPRLAQTSFIADVAGSYEVQLSVMDDFEQASSDTVTITALPAAGD